MINPESSFFVSTAWLESNLAAPDLAIIDATYFLPSEGRSAKEEYFAAHIPGAVFFDIDEIADHRTSLPHMLPEPTEFAKAAGHLGLSEDMRFVVYDGSDLQGGARVWWTLRIFGARDVKLLAGGLPRWRSEGRPLEGGPRHRPPRLWAAPSSPFVVKFNQEAVVSTDAVKRASETGEVQILDARAAARFEGSVPEPREGLRSGHIPGSLNLPWREVVQGGELKPASELKTLMTKAGVNLARPVITTCGSGVTAAILLLALETLGKSGVKLYDGSWSEWGGRQDLPIAAGKG